MLFFWCLSEQIAFLGLLCLLYVADAAAIAPKAGLKRALPVSRSLSKVVPKKTSNDAKPPRSVSAKATVLGDGGYNTLTNMYGKVYDNVIFRQEHGFDPMGLAKGQPPAVLAKYRDAELLHGRMGMLAVAGILLAEKFHPVFPSASGTALQQWDEVNRLVPAFKWFALGHVIVNEAFRTPKFDITHRADRVPLTHTRIFNFFFFCSSSSKKQKKGKEKMN